MSWLSSLAPLRRARAKWAGLLDAPGGRDRVARGAACGAFAAMLPAFGLHVVLAVVAALLLRGSRVTAAGVCLLLGNPLTHAAVLPASLLLGRLILPPMPAALSGDSWLSRLLPAALDTLLGGAILGLLAALVTLVLVLRALPPRRDPP